MHYKIEVIVKSDRSALNLSMFTEGLFMRHLDVKDIVVYPVTHLEGWRG